MSDKGRGVSVLEACVGQARDLAELIEYSEGSVVSKTILDKPAGTLTLFAFDEGQKLSEHTVPYDAVVQILDGRARLTIGPKEVKVSTGQVVIMPGNVPHAVAGDGKFKMLLTMIRA